jgi:hypothetical protein
MKDLPIVCTLTPDTVATRKAQLLPRLVQKADAIEETADGYRLQFAPSSELLTSIASVIDAERRCCRFLRFELAVEPDEGPITLIISGPPGASEFLEAMLQA